MPAEITKYVGEVLKVEYKLKNEGAVETHFKTFPVLLAEGLADRLAGAPQYISGHTVSVVTFKPILEDKGNRELVFLFTPKGVEFVYWGQLEQRRTKPPVYSHGLDSYGILTQKYFMKIPKELAGKTYKLGIVISYYNDAQWHEDDILYVIHQPIIRVLTEEETEKEKRKLRLISLTIK